MPELPEVETVCRGIAPLIESRRLDLVELRREDLRWPIPVQKVQDLTHRRCRRVNRRSKYVLVSFDRGGDDTAIIHLGMSGRMFVDVLTDTHLCLLNKFNVVEHHLLIVTREFEDQDRYLTEEDFAAGLAGLAEYDSLLFYNGP